MLTSPVFYTCWPSCTQKIDRIYRETPEEGHPALKEFPLKLGAAIQQLISGIATDPALQHKVGCANIQQLTSSAAIDSVQQHLGI
eukprot:1160544-Pelagomonas_calceolata.AAC.3